MIMERVRAWCRTTSAALLDILFPPQCAACKTALAEDDRYPCLCNACFDTIELNTYLTCPQCGRRLLSPENSCHPEMRFVLAAAAPYQKTAVRELVHALKYARAKNAARTIGILLKKYLDTLPELDTRAYLAIPIPLHKRRERERGFNQSLLIIQALGTHVPLECCTEILQRVRYTPSQTKTADYRGREENLADSFVVTNPKAVAHRNILLIDDVFTSGATVGAAARALKKAGVKTVVALTFAKG